MSIIDEFIEVGERAFLKGQKDLEFRRPMKVGEFYQNLPQELKEKFSALTSDDLKNIRFDVIQYILVQNPIDVDRWRNKWLR